MGCGDLDRVRRCIGAGRQVRWRSIWPLRPQRRFPLKGRARSSAATSTLVLSTDPHTQVADVLRGCMAERERFGPSARSGDRPPLPRKIGPPVRRPDVGKKKSRLPSNLSHPSWWDTERERFELSRALRPHRFSRPALSTAQPPLLTVGFTIHHDGGGEIRTHDPPCGGHWFSRPALSTAQPPLHWPIV